MATLEKIEFDFRKALGQADKIEEIADRMCRLSDVEFESVMQNLAAGWKGDGASLYLSKGSLLEEKMSGTARRLYSVAADIRIIAKKIYEAEMAALAIATRREL